MTKQCLIIGAGLTGAAAAGMLTDAGWKVTVIEALDEPGGNCRRGSMFGIPYEKGGPHIFHTEDEEIAEFVSPWLQEYRHRVSSVTDAGHFSWPIQLGEMRDTDLWPQIEREIADRPQELPDPASSSFEDYAVAMMGQTLYDLFIRDYTRKQWNRDPASLSAVFAPKRIDLRTDGNKLLFRDRYQGFLDAPGLIGYLLAGSVVYLGDEADVGYLVPGMHAIVTAPLDTFLRGRQLLDWRGMRYEHEYVPSGATPLRTPCVNMPRPECEYIRVTETKQMAGLHSRATVLTYEYPESGIQTYPVNDIHGMNRGIQRELESELTRLFPRAVPAGRLARYLYIDMDQAIRQGWNAARTVMRNAENGSD